MPEQMLRFSRWGKDANGKEIISKTTKFDWVKTGRIEVFKAGGLLFISETFPDAIRRMAAEDAASEAPRRKPDDNFHRAPARAAAAPAE